MNLLLKERTFWLHLIERKLNSLKRGEVVQVVVAFGVVGLRRVDKEQAESPEKAFHLECIINVLLKARTFWSHLKERKFNSLRRVEAVQVVVADEVVGLVGVDDKQSGSPERALRLECITKRLLKARTFRSRLIERKLNSLKRGDLETSSEVVQAKLQRNKSDGLNSWKTPKSLLDSRRQFTVFKGRFNTIE